jgi:DNA polymerase III subunit epsilon
MYSSLTIEKPLAVLDLETTGIDYAKDRIVEIAVIKLFPDGTVEEKCNRLNPTIPIPVQASNIHGIFDKDVADCPTFREVAQEYLQFIDGCDLCGFNSNKFDYPFLVEEFLRCNIEFNKDGRRFIDVQRLFHAMEPRTLKAAYKIYCQKDLVDAHSAAADAKATLEVLNGLLHRYADILSCDFDKLHAMCKGNMDYVDMGQKMYSENGLVKFNFGKHKGKPVTEVFTKEPSYYDWLMNADFPLDFKSRVRTIKESLKA